MRRYLDTKALKRSAHWRNQKIHHHIKTFNKSSNRVEEANDDLVRELEESNAFLLDFLMEEGGRRFG